MEEVKELNKEDIEKIERIENNESLGKQLKSKMISDILKHRCPKCNTALEEVELGDEDFEGMSEGQEIDYDMGFNREFYCPKCKTTELRDVEVFDVENDEIIPTPEQLEALKKDRRNYWSNKRILGYIGECWFANKLRGDGFKVRNTMLFDYETGVSIFNERGVENFLQEYSKKKKLMKLLISFRIGYPDLICLKDGKISFFEVKTKNSEIKEHQKRVIDIIKSEGYEVKVIRLDVDYKVEEVKE